MSKKSGLVLGVAALAILTVLAVYGSVQSPGPLAAGAPSATNQCAACTGSDCKPAGGCEGCSACPAFTDQDNDGVCDTAGTCGKHANGGCSNHQGNRQGCGRHCSNQ